MLPPSLTPSAIVRELDRYVIGQDDAKKIGRGRRLRAFPQDRQRDARRDSAVAKSNVLLIGPSGTGKTLMCETLSRILGVPFVTAEATSLAQTRYVNDEIEAMLQRLVDRAGGDVDAGAPRHRVHRRDRQAQGGRRARSAAASGESVQHALLKIMEGAQVKLGDGRVSSTRPTSCSSAAARSSGSTTSSSRRRTATASSRRRPATTSKILDRLNTPREANRPVRPTA